MERPSDRADLSGNAHSSNDVLSRKDSTVGSPETRLERVVADLQASLDKLTEALATSQSTAKKATEQSAVVQSDLSLAKKAAGAYAGAKEEAAKAIEEATNARVNAQAIIDTLGPDDVDNLNAKIASINQEYQTALDAYATAWQALADHQKAGKDLELEAARKKESFDTAYSELSQLPAEVKGRISPLASLARDLMAASDAGQALKAYVRRSELDVTIKQLQDITSNSRIDELVSDYDSALQDLSNARVAVIQNSDKLAQMKSAVATTQSDAEKAAVKRKEEMDKLYVLQKSTTTSA